jgi:TPR repeat protein
MTLSGGRLFESGVWGVAVTDIGNLKISSSSAASGRNDLTISLVSLDGSLMAETSASLVVRAASTPAAAKADFGDQAVLTATAPQELPRAQEPARRLSPADTERYLAMVRKADDQMRVGNISAARLLYRHAAEAGVAAAALALAATYDDQELRKHHVLGGVQADAKQAQLWYEKARELGSPEARDRLLRLGSR